MHTPGSTNVKVQNVSMGNIIAYTINCNYKMTAKLYTLGTWFISDI